MEPFAAMVFNLARCGELRNLVAPPYDLIDDARQAELYARSPWNVIRLELSREADPYGSAVATLRQWVADGILERTARRAIYFYTQDFENDGRKLRRNGL